MNEKCFWRRACCTALAAATISWVTISCAPPMTPAPNALTRSRLKNVYHTMQVLEKENHMTIAAQVLQITNESMTLQQKWAVLVSMVAPKDTPGSTFREQMCRDGWTN